MGGKYVEQISLPQAILSDQGGQRSTPRARRASHGGRLIRFNEVGQGAQIGLFGGWAAYLLEQGAKDRQRRLEVGVVADVFQRMWNASCYRD